MTTTTRRKRTLSPEELAAGGTPHVAATAGPTPTGAIGGDQVLSAARNRAETGQTAPTAVPEGYGEVTGTGIETTGDVGATMPKAPTILDGGEGTGGGGTTYSDDATVGAEGEEGATGEMAPYQSIDDLFEQYARDSFGEVDTSEEEAQMQAQQDRLLGRGLVDTRARMGEAGFAAGGLDVALENTARAQAAEQLGLDISNIRDREGEQRRGAIEGAMGIDLDKQESARQDALTQARIDAYNKLLEDDGEAPPADDGSGNPVDDAIDSLPDGPVKDALKWTGDVNGDGTININDLVAVRGADAMTGEARNPAEAVTATNAGDVRVPDTKERRNAASVSSSGDVPEPYEDAGTYGADHYYWGADGNLYKVRASTMTGDY